MVFLLSLITLISVAPAIAEPLTPRAALAAEDQAPAWRPAAEFTTTSMVLMGSDFFGGAYSSHELAFEVLHAGAELGIVGPDSKEVRQQLLRLPKLGDFGTRIQALPLATGNLWLRDYGPLMAVQSAPSRRVYVDFRYGGPEPHAERLPSELQAKDKNSLYLDAGTELDGGDFLTDGATCVTSWLAGSSDPTPKLAKLGCQRTIAIPDPPHPHVDMWLKIAAPGVALVNTLAEEAEAHLIKTYGHLPAEHQTLKQQLNQAADLLSQYFKVHRLPMPLVYRGAYRTYANALLVNGTAILPSYQRYGFGYDDYPDADKKTNYENRAVGVYQSLGYRVRFVNADGLIYNGGAFHCIAVQIPKIDEAPVFSMQISNKPKRL